MRITKSAVVFGVLLGGVAPLEAQLQSSNPPEQAWIQGGTLPDVAEEGDSLSGYYSYQRALATGDFNGDTIMDLAIGVPYEDVSSGPSVLTDAGIVHVVYGRSGGGLDPTTAQTLGQGTGGLLDSPASDEYFGRELASGDFDGDGVDDLAIGVTGQKIGGLHLAGAVHIVYGEKGLGLGVRNHVLYQGLFPNSDQAEANDSFGWSLAAGDFNGDLIDDLAVGAHGDSVAGFSYAGLVVEYLALAKDGLANPICGVVTQDRIPGGVNEANDQFGWALAAGDFDGDGYADLAAGAPWEFDAEVGAAGRVTIFYGAAGGLAADPRRSRQIDEGTLEGAGQRGNHYFASALTSGDFNGDGYRDLAIGTSVDVDVNGVLGGAVHVVFGSRKGLTRRFQHLGQDMPADIADEAEELDLFGNALAAGDFNDDGIADLAVGATGEDDAGGQGRPQGMAHIIYGSRLGLTSAANEVVKGYPSEISGSEFAFRLAAGDFNGDGRADLAIGCPGANSAAGEPYVGTVKVVYPRRDGRRELWWWPW